MEIVTDRTEYEILSILDRKNRAVTSAEIEKELQKIGIDITRRRIIQYLEILDGKGFSENLGREGRRITDAGREEVGKALAHTKVNYVTDKTIRLATEMKFDLEKQKGNIAVNLSIFDKDKEEYILKILKDICTNLPIAPPYIKIAHDGEILGDYEIPKGKIGLATITSLTIDGIFLKNGIYTIPRYCGLVEFYEHKPIRFVNLLPGAEISIDPFELFLPTAMTTVHKVLKKGQGLIPGDYREFNYVAKNEGAKIIKQASNVFGGMYLFGYSNVLGISVKENMVGTTVFGGEVLIFALNECGVLLENRFAYALIDFKELEPLAPIKGEVLGL